MSAQGSVGFGDAVRIRSTPETEQAGVAGLSGQVYGVTTPSVTRVEVIGVLKEDVALNVHVDERGEALWFAEDLLEFVDHAPGTEIRMKGSGKAWTREPDGSWTESTPPLPQKRWWEFWR